MQEYSEDALIEQPAIALLAELGYTTIRAMHEVFGVGGTLGRGDATEVVLRPRLRAALVALNPGIPANSITQAIDVLLEDRGMRTLASANRDVYHLLKDGITVDVHNDEGGTSQERLRVIDWNVPDNNDFLVVSQFSVQGTLYGCRPDAVIFVNGLPLIVFEFKRHDHPVVEAYHDNIRHYLDQIPALFWYNAAIIVSNGVQSKMGSITSGWEHYFEWKKISDEGEVGAVALETMLRGVCERQRLLDIIENFTVFRTEGKGLVKLIARNHQYLGVNNAYAALDNRGEHGGQRLGVFWHTQGSGKSLSMVFFAQKVFRKRGGNWTFVIVTDRDSLDTQIYSTFSRTGAADELGIQAQSGEELRQLLRDNHRYVFTLIQKFQSDEGRPYPVLSDRADIIVMTDEAHRTQYASLAKNMRAALPNAAYIGFTGTPLMAGEGQTREVFGDYVSIYNFRQSITDGATVPLYYENRIPHVQLTNADLDSDIAEVIEAAELDDAQQTRLEREFARSYHLITRDDRLDTIAADIVDNFLERGEQGKAMVVSIDKQTAVKMYDRVRKHWALTLDKLKKELLHARELKLTEAQIAHRKQRVEMMRKLDMAVVVSKAQNEIPDFKAKGLDIERHRTRMVKEDLEEKFKDATDPLQIVFVCAMWMTGFDVPSLNTIYLDKPMRDHTLMQTIARANRVFHDKTSGVIVDYIGVFRNLKQALAIYGSGSGGGVAEGDLPVHPKTDLVAALSDALTQAETFYQANGVDCAHGLQTTGFVRVAFIDGARDQLLINDETRDSAIALASTVALCYRAMLPSTAADEYSMRAALIISIGRHIREVAGKPDITDVLASIENVLDVSIAADSYVIREESGSYAVQRVDLSTLDPERLRAFFAGEHQRTEATKLRNDIAQRVKKMVQRNATRTSYLEHFQRLIDEYNAGSLNTAAFFEELISFTQTLNTEEQRAVTERLTEEELALFDLIAKGNDTLTEPERTRIKKVAHDLVTVLRREKLVLDWRKRQQARAAVQVTIADAIDNEFSDSYPHDVRQNITSQVYDHILKAYQGDGMSHYGAL